MAKKMTFALAFCNKGFMPGEVIYGARDDMNGLISTDKLLLERGMGGLE